MRIYIGIGATVAQELSFQVLKYTIKKHNPENEIIIEIIGDTTEFKELSGSLDVSYGTVFSLQRFLVPEIANRHQADICLHLDSDMLCMQSFQSFFDLIAKNKDKILLPLPNPNFEQPQQTAVFGCDVDEWTIDLFGCNLNDFLEKKISYKELMRLSFSEDKILPCSHIYNSREYFDDDTVILHLTDLYRQPWVNRFNELEGVWFNELEAAILDDNNLLSVLDDGVRKQYYLPSLLRFSGKKPAFSMIRDLFFLPPQFDAYAQLKFGKAYTSGRLRIVLKLCVIAWVKYTAVWHATVNYRKI